MPETRTRQAALDALLALRAETVATYADTIAQAVVDESLLRNVFAEAWTHQFDDDLSEMQRAVRDLVVEAVERAIPREGM